MKYYVLINKNTGQIIQNGQKEKYPETEDNINVELTKKNLTLTPGITFNKHDCFCCDIPNKKFRAYTKLEKEQIQIEKEKERVKNNLIELQLKVDTGKKLNIDMSNEENQLTNIKLEYNKIK